MNWKKQLKQLCYADGKLNYAVVVDFIEKLLKPKDKLGDDFTKFLKSEGYEVIDCKPEDTL